MSIKPFENNPRQISKKEHARLTKDLADLGDLGGICHDLDTNSLIGGNQRSEIMGVISGVNAPIITETFDPPTKQGTVALGYIEWRGEKYAYRAVKGWSDEQRRRANIEANRAGGAWDVDILSSWDAKELISIGFDEDWLRDQGKMYGAVLNMLESEKPEPVDAEPQIDRAEELQKVWQVRKGDLWQIGEHRLLCGDCANSNEIDTLLRLEKLGAQITDPPYGVNVVKSEMVGADFGVAKKGKYAPIVGDEKAPDVSHLLSSAPVTIIWGGNYFADKLPPVNSWLVWDKRSDSGIENTFADCELAWTNLGSPARVFRQLWNGMIREGEREKRVHPTQKSVALFQWCAEKTRGIIGDFYAGSGTMLVACQNLDRQCFAVEISEAYCSVILQRMSDAFPGIEIKRLSPGADE